MAADSLFTLSDLAEQVGLNLGAVDDISLAKCKKHINRALIRFSEMGMWPFQYRYAQALNTVASTEDYTVTGAIKYSSLYTSQPIQRKLTLIEDRKFRAMFPNNTAVGTPYYYREAGWSTHLLRNSMKISLYPIPDGVYNLKYDGLAPITLLSADTDDIRTTTGMPSHLVDLVIEMATAIGWKEIASTEMLRSRCRSA